MRGPPHTRERPRGAASPPAVGADGLAPGPDDGPTTSPAAAPHAAARTGRLRAARRRAAGVLAGLATVAAALLLAPAPARAVEEVVDLELVLAVDVSWSMDIEEQILQREGYVAAFRHPEVIAAIGSGEWGRIAVTYVEWAGVGLHRTRVPWMVVEDAATADAFATRLAAAPMGRLRRTSISSALDMVAPLFEENAVEGMRRVVDISGDGPNNMGGPVEVARDRLIEQGITVNGLPIMLKRPTAGSFFQIADLDVYYEDCVIGGAGAFVITVTERAEFADAIRRKLVLEIAGLVPNDAPDLPVMRAGFRHLLEEEPRIDCMIGEKLWNKWQHGRW